MKYALVDLGSNTIRLSVYDVQYGRFSQLFSEKETAGLNNYVSDGRMSEDGIARACSALLRFKELAGQFDIDVINVFATASLRNINNGVEAAGMISERTGLDVGIISGEEESRLGCIGALSGFDLRDGAVFDIGGGSTEIAAINDGVPSGMQSLPVGSLALFNAHVDKIIPKKDELDAIHKDARSVLKSAGLPRKKECVVCGIGGTARAVLKCANAMLGFNPGSRMLSIQELEMTAEALKKGDKKARTLILKNCPDRLHTIIPGAILMLDICHALGCRELYVSPYGVREGYLLSRLGLAV